MTVLPFEYAAPASAADAVALLRAEPDAARVIGGGTWVVGELHRGESQPTLVVDLRRAGLDAIEHDGDTVGVGAMCTYSALLDSGVVATHLPLLHLAAGGVTGGRQILNQGTLGGSVAAAHPHSDMPAVVTALGARAVIAGPGGERTVAITELFAGPSRTGLGPAEILVRLEVSSSRALGHGYYKLKHGGSSSPIATAAALVALDAAGTCSAVTLTLGGVAGTPLSIDLTGVLVGREPDEAALADAGRVAGQAVHAPFSDLLASGTYRAAVAPAVAVRALRMAVDHARRLAGHDSGRRS
jgi:carbon-monoxide dehydrogenase medium subunit